METFWLVIGSLNHWFRSILTKYTGIELFWLILGIFAQGIFFARFFVQWVASEKAGKSVVPVVFWYFSIFGGLLLMTYAIHIKDPVFIIGQATGLLIYCRNLYLIAREKRNTKSGG
jgi:lipid-A-disaccharide synthase-like uncharacterized protein